MDMKCLKSECPFLSRVVSTLKAPLWAESWLAVALRRRGRITGRKCAARDRQRRLAGTTSNQMCSRIGWLCFMCSYCNLKKTLKKLSWLLCVSSILSLDFITIAMITTVTPCLRIESLWLFDPPLLRWCRDPVMMHRNHSRRCRKLVGLCLCQCSSP